MARVELPVTVLNPTTGLPVNGASVAISQRSNAAAVTWWTAETGGTSSTAAVVTDSSGRATAWVARGAYNLTISGAGITTYVEPWDAIPASDLGGDTLWLPDGSVTNAKLASGIDAGKLTTGTMSGGLLGSTSLPASALADASITIAKMAAGAGSRLLNAFVLPEYTITGAQTSTLLAATSVTHNNKAGIAIALVGFRSGGTSTPSLRVYTDSVVVASSAYSLTSVSETGLAIVVYNYSVLSGSHTWSVDITQASGSTVTGDGTGILLLFEQY